MMKNHEFDFLALELNMLMNDTIVITSLAK